MEQSNLLTTLLSNPYVSGLLIAIIFFLYIRSLMKIREMSKDIKKLREHLHTKLEIESADNERRKAETEQLKQ